MTLSAFAPERRRTRRGWMILAVFAALALLWLFALSRLYVNASWSDAAWGYLLLPLPGEPAVGEVVLFLPPETIGTPVPYLKTVLGLPGAKVTVDPDRNVRVAGMHAGKAKIRARNGRPLAPIPSGVVPPDHYYLFADHPDSHDSRYAEIGFVPRTRLLGRAVALPDISWLGLSGPLVGPESIRANPDVNAALDPDLFRLSLESEPGPFQASPPEVQR